MPVPRLPHKKQAARHETAVHLDYVIHSARTCVNTAISSSRDGQKASRRYTKRLSLRSCLRRKATTLENFESSETCGGGQQNVRNVRVCRVAASAA